MSTSQRRDRHTRARQHQTQRQRNPLTRSPVRQMMAYVPTMLEVDAAEARGDAVGALAAMQSLSEGVDGRPFWRPWRVRTLSQMAELGPILPGWSVSRWVAEQAVGCMADVSSDRARQALHVAADLRGGEAAVPRSDDVDAMARLVDHDWVYRQVHLYELGGLRAFVQDAAGPDLLAGADRIHDWCDAPMSVCRLVGRTSSTETWWDRVNDRELTIPNLGAAAETLPGEAVLTRVMPAADGFVFDGASLGVTDDIAERVADDPDQWLATLRWARDQGYQQLPHLPRSSILTDLSELSWQSMFYNGRQGRNWNAPLTQPSHLARAALLLARAALDAAWPEEDDVVDVWSSLGAALVEPGVSSAIVGQAQEDDVQVLERLADRLAEPYSRVCADAVLTLRSAA